MLIEMDLLNCVTTPNLLPSSAKPLRALGTHSTVGRRGCSILISRKHLELERICNLNWGKRRRPVSRCEEKKLPPPRTDPCPHVVGFMRRARKQHGMVWFPVPEVWVRLYLIPIAPAPAIT